LRIAIVTPLYPLNKDCDSGIAIHYQHLANGLKALGHEVIIYFFPYEVFESKVFNNDKLTIYQVGCSLPKIFFLKGVGRLLRSLKVLEWYPTLIFQKQICDFLKKRVIEDKIEIIESTSNRGLLAKYAKSKDRPPICTRISTTMASSYKNAKLAVPLNYRIESKLEYQQIMRSDSLITHSKGHSRELEKELGISRNRIETIPIGIPIPISITDNQVLAASNSKVEVLFVGRLERRKGIEVLLKAIPLALKSNGFLVFTIIGSDPSGFKDSFLEYSKVNDQVKFTGKVSKDELSSAYQICDIFVAPSYYESFGIIFTEAMSRGKPVIGTNVGGIPDIVSHNKDGILVPPGNEIDLAAAIIRLADSPKLRSSMGLAGRKKMKENFSVTEMTKRSVQYYEEVLSGKRY
jgi:glycosyltransferase involved in cell wall biosynthesis